MERLVDSLCDTVIWWHMFVHSGPLLEIHGADSPRWRRQLQEIWKLMRKTQGLQHGCWASWHAPLAERFTIISCTKARTLSHRILGLVTLYCTILYSCRGMLLSYVVIIYMSDFLSEKSFPWDSIEICSLPKQIDMIHLRCRSSCSSSGASPSVAWLSQRCQAGVGANFLSDTSSTSIMSKPHSSGFRSKDSRSMSTTQVQPPGSNIVDGFSHRPFSILLLFFILFMLLFFWISKKCCFAMTWYPFAW